MRHRKIREEMIAEKFPKIDKNYKLTNPTIKN
jgi:hypothetical protein